jgi:hypothetical protein
MSNTTLNCIALGFIAFMAVLNVAVIVIGTIILTIKERGRFRNLRPQPPGFEVMNASSTNRQPPLQH